MAWQVNWTEVAQNDLDKIASYIAQDSENYAAAFVRELLDAARSLEQLAQRGRIVPERQDSNTAVCGGIGKAWHAPRHSAREAGYKPGADGAWKSPRIIAAEVMSLAVHR